jgi:hypothetical protein
MCDLDEAEFREYLRYLEAAAEGARVASEARRTALETPVAAEA